MTTGRINQVASTPQEPENQRGAGCPAPQTLLRGSCFDQLTTSDIRLNPFLAGPRAAVLFRTPFHFPLRERTFKTVRLVTALARSQHRISNPVQPLDRLLAAREPCSHAATKSPETSIQAGQGGGPCLLSATLNKTPIHQCPSVNLLPTYIATALDM